jgi:hypothetical protein
MLDQLVGGFPRAGVALGLNPGKGYCGAPRSQPARKKRKASEERNFAKRIFSSFGSAMDKRK